MSGRIKHQKILFGLFVIQNYFFDLFIYFLLIILIFCRCKFVSVYVYYSFTFKQLHHFDDNWYGLTHRLVIIRHRSTQLETWKKFYIPDPTDSTDTTSYYVTVITSLAVAFIWLSYRTDCGEIWSPREEEISLHNSPIKKEMIHF